MNGRPSPQVHLFAGTYADGGFWKITHEVATDRWTARPWMRSLTDISYAVPHPRLPLFYLVEEAEPGRVHAVDLDQRVVIATCPTGGDAPCYVSVSPDATALAVANYGSGSVTLVPLDPVTGDFAAPPQVRAHQGRGPHPQRQTAPHVHCAVFSPDGNCLYAVDLGTDRVIGYPIKDRRLRAPFVAVSVEPGEGPRHLVFHPDRPLAFLLTELGSRLYALRVETDGRLTPIDSMSTLPAETQVASLGGHLALNADATQLFLTNRGHDSLLCVDFVTSGYLQKRHSAPSLGASPRAFAFTDDGRLVVAHEKSQALAMFEVDETGKMTASGRALAIPSVAFIMAF